MSYSAQKLFDCDEKGDINKNPIDCASYAFIPSPWRNVSIYGSCMLLNTKNEVCWQKLFDCAGQGDKKENQIGCGVILK